LKKSDKEDDVDNEYTFSFYVNGDDIGFGLEWNTDKPVDIMGMEVATLLTAINSGELAMSIAQFLVSLYKDKKCKDRELVGEIIQNLRIAGIKSDITIKPTEVFNATA